MKNQNANISNPLISLCIPTNGIVDWVIPVIRSIYSQNVDNSLYEIVIADNGVDSNLGDYLSEFNYPNIFYHKTTEQGFVNQIASFKLANGVFRKMLNHRGLLIDGALKEMVNIIRKFVDTKPILYFSDGRISTDEELLYCRNIDEFVDRLNYFCTWSAGVGIWDIDVKSLYKKPANKMFPHTYLMFEVRSDTSFVLWNKKYLKMMNDKGKGGYDVFHTFAVDFLDLMTDLLQQNRISTKSYKNVKYELHTFLSELYYTEKLRPRIHTYIIKDIKQSVCIHYSLLEYYLMLFKAFLFFPKSAIRNIKDCFGRNH